MPATPCPCRVLAPGAVWAAGLGLWWEHPAGGCCCLCCPQLWPHPVSLLSCAQYEVSGEEHLYSDFPEIDLSQLDAGDLDSAGCFSELQWGGEHSETDSSQYSTDDSELFQVPPSPEDGGRGRSRVGGGNTHNY